MCQLYLKQVCDLALCKICYVLKLIKSFNFKEAHIKNRLMHLTENFAVKLLQIVVSDVSPKQVPARILLTELTTIINFCRLSAAKNTHL